MSQIDLKRATVYLRDGYALNGLSDSTATIAIGATTIACDGFVGAVEVGIYARFGTDPQRYTVTARTNTLGNTTNLTITPALEVALPNNTVIATGPHSLAIKNGEGTFSFTEKKARQYTKDRGVLSEVRNADEDPVEWSMDLIYEFLESESGATTPTPREVFNKIGAASAWVSSDTDACRPYAVDIVVEYDPDCGTTDKEVVTVQDARHEQADFDLKAGTIKVSGKSNHTLVDTTRTDDF